MRHTVRDLMATGVISAQPDETVGAVREKMSHHNIGAVPIVDSSAKLKGIVTTDNLLSGYEPTIPVSRVMTTPVQTLPSRTGVRAAARLMRKNHRHHVVVVDDDQVVGVLSSFDLLRILEISR